MFYSKTTNSFYDPEINSVIPEDAVEITVKKWQKLLSDQASGKIITSDSNGNPISVAQPAPTKDQTIVQYEGAAQKNLDSVAKEWGYDSMLSAVSYVNSTNPQYNAESNALIQWRDIYWTKAYDIEAGTLPKTADEFIALLPPAPAKPTV